MVPSHIRSNQDVGLKPAHSPPRILVVDDDKAIRQFQMHVLVRSGYHVDVAEDGLAGWEALSARPFDLLITDQHMPGLSGLELAAKVQSARMSLPVILVAAPLPEGKLERNPSIQLAATLAKPFSPAQLEQTVKRALAQHANRPPTAAAPNQVRNPLSLLDHPGKPRKRIRRTL